jgi:HK97 family phage portal protein
MRLFGFEIGRVKTEEKTTYSTPESRAGWWPVVMEPFGGAWQRNIMADRTLVLSYHAVYACMTLISGDISKLGVRLVEQLEGSDIWIPTTSPIYSGVIRKPNHYQTRIQFWENWILSKLIHGNTYALKRRNQRGFVSALYILDPTRVKPLISEHGDVFYELMDDHLRDILGGQVKVPDREIIHDRMNCLFHPLCGVSPIYANALPALQGLSTQENSKKFFENNSNPGGILTAPGKISADTVTHLKQQWDNNYTGINQGKVAILGDGLKFERMVINAVDSQLIEQLKWSAETVCSTYHVPPYMIGVGQQPSYNNVQALNQQYYSQALQNHIESAELCLKEGLSLPDNMDIKFNLADLLTMDTATKTQTIKDGISAGMMAPNEARALFDLKPVKGGDTPYLQQQNFSLAALDERDKLAPPPVTGGASPPSAETDNDDSADDNKEAERNIIEKILKRGIKLHARSAA